jgi:hypothetical protein
MVPLNLPASPHIAKSRMQIAPTPKASEARDSPKTQSIRSIELSWNRVAVVLIYVKISESLMPKARRPATGPGGHEAGAVQASQQRQSGPMSLQPASRMVP